MIPSNFFCSPHKTSNSTRLLTLKWLRVDKSKLQILQHQLDPSANFTSYRATLKAAIWRSEGAKNDAEMYKPPSASDLYD
uniref:Uncharacterized protein n=1 Tax=Parascaris equorum TaxID=6256 RepID=A0A914SIY5_PAREQ